MEEYLISFSSFYKAAYAQDTLGEAGISSSLRKLPTELMRSCSTGLYLRNDHIEEVRSILRGRNITATGIYRIVKSAGNKREYVKVK